MTVEFAQFFSSTWCNRTAYFFLPLKHGPALWKSSTAPSPTSCSKTTIQCTFTALSACPQIFQNRKYSEVLYSSLVLSLVFSDLIICWPSCLKEKKAAGFSLILKILLIFTVDDQREIGSSSQVRKIKAFFPPTNHFPHLLVVWVSLLSLEHYGLGGNCNCRDNLLSVNFTTLRQPGLCLSPDSSNNLPLQT